MHTYTKDNLLALTKQLESDYKEFEKKTSKEIAEKLVEIKKRISILVAEIVDKKEEGCSNMSCGQRRSYANGPKSKCSNCEKTNGSFRFSHFSDIMPPEDRAVIDDAFTAMNGFYDYTTRGCKLKPELRSFTCLSSSCKKTKELTKKEKKIVGLLYFVINIYSKKVRSAVYPCSSSIVMDGQISAFTHCLDKLLKEGDDTNYAEYLLRKYEEITNGVEKPKSTTTDTGTPNC